MNPETRELRSRWRSGNGKKLQAELTSRILGARPSAAQPLAGLRVETVDGRADLRGFLLESTPGPPHVRGATFTGVDFRLARMRDLRLFGCRFENCRFDGADLAGWRQWATDVVDCTFAGADLQQASLGGWDEGRGNVFRGCDFSGAVMVRIETSAATYVDCRFDNARLDDVNFWQSSLIGCTFAGPLSDVVFDGRMLNEPKPDPNPMRDVDLSRAVFDGVEFRGVTFDRIRLPKDPDLYLVPDPAVLRPILASLATERDLPGRIGRMILEKELGIAQAGGGVLLNLRDFGEGGPRMAERLRAAGLTPLG
jgi:uncharacterized protein YjbI with pentapeptide repeats